MLYLEPSTAHQLAYISRGGAIPSTDLVMTAKNTVGNAVAAILVETFAVVGDYVRVTLTPDAALGRGEWEYQLTFSDADGNKGTLTGLLDVIEPRGVRDVVYDAEVTYKQYDA